MNENRILMDKISARDTSIGKLNELVLTKEKQTESHEERISALLAELDMCKQKQEEIMLR